jgi:hypothetical protein
MVEGQLGVLQSMGTRHVELSMKMRTELREEMRALKAVVSNDMTALKGDVSGLKSGMDKIIKALNAD